MNVQTNTVSKANKKSNINKNATLLSPTPDLALRQVVTITQRILDLSEQETQCLITNDLLQFAYLQQDKDRLASRYARASEEFRSRINEFHGSNRAVLNKLEKLQNDLHQKSVENNSLIDRMKTRAQANTNATLFSVQEMGQRVSVPILTAATNAETNKQQGRV